jgi:DNA-binding response OmpR family regulator
MIQGRNLSRPTTASSPGPYRLLLVDDDDAVRQLIAEALRDDGYVVTEAAEAASALAQLRAARFDLLVTDLGLPGGMTGQQLARAAQALQPGLKILAITGYTALPAAEDGGFDILAKPFALGTLGARVTALLA